MTDDQQREAARQFFYKWTGKGKEKEDARSYWIDILTNIFGLENVTDRVVFEKTVYVGGTPKFIDVYIPETRVVIEHKSLGIPLDKPQAGHGGKTPYEQAKEYDNYLQYDERARWIITSNFAEIWIYDRNAAKPEPIKLTLADLQTKYHLLSFLIKKDVKQISQEMEVSLQAGEIVGLLYDAFQKRYKNPDSKATLKCLNKLCVRIVFCLYGEDAGIFGKREMFHDYMAQFSSKKARSGLVKLFRILNQKPEDRDPYLADDDPLLAAFPYVNGGLFDGDDIEIPPFTDEIMDLLLVKASQEFDWSGISPTIFGAVFESTLNPETRRSGGMHYTSIENIHKVIDPLFLDDLKAELEDIKSDPVLRTRKKRLQEYQDKLASLYFLDPAAGSGNFLTESYTCIRKLENLAVNMLLDGQMTFGEMLNPIKVSISQFSGIEINDFAVTVARTALWIAENQMMKETEDIVHAHIEFLPLKTSANIVEGNALRIDWNDVIPRFKLNYIMGNPPFVGARLMSGSQKSDLLSVFENEKNIGNLDYVAGWYIKAARYMANTPIKAAFVSTNSITQGEQVPILWKPIFELGASINFAYRTFRWDSEANIKAHVHCVIIGFSFSKLGQKQLYFSDTFITASNINPYLVDGPNILVQSRKNPICDVDNVVFGSMPNDGGFLSNFTDEQKNAIVDEYPITATMFRQFLGATEFLHSKIRWCLWLKGISPADIKKAKPVIDAINSVKKMRESSNRASTRKLADTPYLFGEIRQPETNYIIIPRHTSQNRRYIPMGFISPDIICGDANLLLPNATLYQFGVMMSNVHNSWVRTICGRIKSDYRYSVNVVYNNFPWPDPTDAQRNTIAKTAQEILNARNLYPDSSLADLYDPLTMPPELRTAHDKNNAAVMAAYGMPIKKTDEASCVAWLMRLYQDKVKE